ncbi:MAG TPA: riboflavin synthase [Bacteroidota bacterium]|nr:riboflavin synthase [Bacteroidota bacterium]
MFTGIITEVGRVEAVKREGGSNVITVRAPRSAPELRVDDSVAVSGVCLTVIARTAVAFTAQAVEETLLKTTLGALEKGSAVNLEMPLRLSDRLGGHIVLGHVDCVGRVSAVEARETSTLLSIGYPAEFARYVVPVGSVALDGISLTIAAAGGSVFTVSVIPHTLAATTLGRAAAGARVNIEFDILGKYVERLAAGEQGNHPASTLSAEKLREWGYKI